MERFFKYHGLGNDFVILDRRESGRDIDAATTRALCDRHRGIGADGVLVLLTSPAGHPQMVVHNADGDVGEMCGNGLRCAVKYLVDHGTAKPAELSVQTGAGLLACRVRYERGLAEEVEVQMGAAQLQGPLLPSHQPFVRQPLAFHPGVVGTALVLGVPHLVLFDRPLEDAARLGPALERSPLFPARTNVDVAQVERGAVSLAVWERGCGLTLACGTGACATVAAGVHEGRLPGDQWIPVTLPGGTLRVRVSKDLSEVVMVGPATAVFEGDLPQSQ